MRWLRQVSLRVQIFVLVLSFVLAVGLGNALRAHLALDDLAQEQFERRSVATALGLAAQAADPTLADDPFRLYELLNTTMVNTADVRYIFVMDNSGSVLAHTFGPGLPRGLTEANPLPPGAPWQLRRLNTEEGTVVDVAAPLLEGQSGTLRLGMSEQALQAAIDRHTWQLIELMAISILPVLVVTYLLGQMLTIPLLKLVEATNAVRHGELTRQVPVEGRDEVAELGRSFNAMAKSLAQSQDALKESNRALQTSNDELAALYALATAIAHVNSIDSLLQAALNKSLEVMGLTVGWVFLFPETAADQHPTLRVVQGVPPDMTPELSNRLSGDCQPEANALLEQAGMAHDDQPCPCLAPYAGTLHATRHAVVPLVSRTRLWGMMHLACPTATCFSPAQFNLLTAIGRQIGLAIENVRLSQAQRREAFRRSLLDKVLTAQEEERKRVARELHDELAQNLAVLIRDLEGIAAPQRHHADLSSVQTRAHDTRALALRILEQTRHLIFNLRPSALDHLGLLPTLRRYTRHHLGLAHIDWHITVTGPTRRLPPAVETTLFRIAQEAINNVVKHAQASHIQLDVHFAPHHITLTVTDDGIGFLPDKTLTNDDNTAYSIGILGMRERAELLDGHLTITSAPGTGTSVQVTIPVEASL